MDEESILEYWCEPWQLLDPATADLFTERALFIEGGRGCGKTMLLRYLSFEVQKLDATKKKMKFLDLLTSRKAVAFYIRIDNAVLTSFQGLDKRTRAGFGDSLFSHYFELTVCRWYVQLLKELQNEDEIRNGSTSEFFTKFAKILGVDHFQSIADLEAHLDHEIDRVDSYRRDIAFVKVSFKPIRSFGIGDLTVKASELICSTFEPLRKLRLLIAIDEYENFSEAQQRLINSLIRSQAKNVGFRLGMRQEGLKTLETVQKDEFIKENHDFRMLRFRDVLVKDTLYRTFLRDLAAKRLQSIPFFRDAGMTDIEKILGKEDDVREARELIASRSNPSSHFAYLENAFSPERVSEIIPVLTYPENPLLEMLNIVWVLRGRDPEYVRETMNEYLRRSKQHGFKKSNVKSYASNEEPWRKYWTDYVNKYKLSLLFLLTYHYKVSKKYYGFNIFCFISSGIPRNFINLCKTAFLKAHHYLGPEKLVEEKTIPDWIQDEAAKGEASIELHNITALPEFADLIYNFARNLGKRFQEYHNDPYIRFPETNTFSVKKLDDQNREVLRVAVRWSVVQRKARLQAPGPSESPREIYALNHFLSPFFNISYRTRGGFAELERLSNESFSKLCSADGLPPLAAKKRQPQSYLPGQKRIDEDWR